MAAKDINPYLDWVRGECAAAGVRFILGAEDKPRSKVYGTFDHEDRKLTVCAGDARWLLTLAHEVGHLRQWVERPQFYTSELADLDAFDKWVAGKKVRGLTPVRLRRIVRALQRLELDAERRAVHIIREWNLTDNVGKYIQNANEYVWRYEVARRLRKWVRFEDSIDQFMPVRLITQRQLGKPPEAMLDEQHFKAPKSG